MKKILIVDDSEPTRRIIERILEGEGHATQSVADADATVESLDRQSFHLVMMDVDLGGDDGVALAKRVLQDYPQQRLILMSGDPSNRSRAAEASLPFIDKPFEIPDLLAIINQQ
ncbi:MAG: response regulator [Elusimicrobiota bacterium]